MNDRLSAEAWTLIITWLAGIALVFLKVYGLIDWPWVFVTAPFWAPFAFLLLLLTLGTVLAAVARFVGWMGRKLWK